MLVNCINTGIDGILKMIWREAQYFLYSLNVGVFFMTKCRWGGVGIEYLVKVAERPLVSRQAPGQGNDESWRKLGPF